jgi:peptide/nickel transport system substrate-binding protein
VSGGFGTVATSSVFPELPEANTELAGYPYNLEQATALLAEAGWTDADGNGVLEASGVEGVEDGTPFHIVITTYTTPAWTTRAQIVQQFLQELGVEAEVNTVEANALFAQYLNATSEYDVILSGWVNLLIPTLSDLVANFRTGEANTVVLRWSNEELDGLLDAIPTIFDDQERIDAFWRAQEIIEEEVPVIYLDRSAANVAHSADLVLPEIGSVIELFESVPQWEWNS